MRTTIYLDDHLAAELKRAAARRGMSLSAFLAESGRAALAEPVAACGRFELLTYGCGGPQPGVDLDRTGELVEEDDRERYRGVE